MRVLLLEDEYSLRITIEEFLQELNFVCDSFGDGDDAFDAIFEKGYDLLLLDVKVRGKNGFEFLEGIRKEGLNTPAIFITSLTSIEDLSRGYNCGCCDYIRKPFDLKELQLRLEQAIRSNCLNSKSELIALPLDYFYDTKNFVLKSKDKEVQLTKTEKLIIELLIKNRGKVISIEDFMEIIWGNYINSANVRVQINHLRKKLDKDLIVNVRGLGYKIEL